MWALQNYGFRVVIAAAVRRHLPRQLRQEGLLTAQVAPGDDVELLWKLPSRTSRAPRGDRRPRGSRTVRGRRHRRAFEIDDYTRWRLLEGLDDIGLTLRHEQDVTDFEARRPAYKPSTTVA